MRIITGSARGCKLKQVPGETTRPTRDMVKEALFSIIQFDIEGRTVLDLFAGTGQLGLEALSRGAKKAVFIDHTAAAIKTIRENAAAARLSDRCEIRQSDYKAFLQSAPKRSFHIVLMDPPYMAGYLKRVLNFIETFDIVADNGIIICEGKEGETMPAEIGRMRLVRTYKYGITSLHLYRREPETIAAPEADA
ncbi:MAG: 16S rRNA (guanine(966)-N(2))-methyltransferase RsmD [Clostridia bacterium]|nr:16S rRNA (guanine(966)-N(2))-methyltransferase RsmD [Clostridia bacterium]